MFKNFFHRHVKVSDKTILNAQGDAVNNKEARHGYYRTEAILKQFAVDEQNKNMQQAAGDDIVDAEILEE